MITRQGQVIQITISISKGVKSINLWQDCNSCNIEAHTTLSPEEAEQLANELLSLAQDIREKNDI